MSNLSNKQRRNKRATTLTIITQPKKTLDGGFVMLALGLQIGLRVAHASCVRRSFVQTQTTDSATGMLMCVLAVFIS